MAITGDEIVTCKQFAEAFGINANESSFSDSPMSVKQAKMAYANLIGETVDGTESSDYSNIPLTVSQVKLLKEYVNSTYLYFSLEWLGFDGDQLVDTDYYPKGDTRVVMNCYIDSSNPNGELYALFGGRTANTSNTFGLWRYDASSFRYDYGSSTNRIYISPTTGNFVIDANKNSITLNDTKYSYTYKSFTSSNTLRIASNYSTTSEYDSRRFAGKLYYLKIYDNETLVRDYVPAERRSDKVLGLYDKVEKKFYENDGSGSFTSGSKTGYI